MFLSAQYAAYIRHHLGNSLVRILPKSLYGKNAPEEDVPHAFFSHYYGSSWHDDDAGFIDLLAHWGTTFMVFAAGIAAVIALRVVLVRRRDRDGYETLPLVVGNPERAQRFGSRVTMPPRWLIANFPLADRHDHRLRRGRTLSALPSVSVDSSNRQSEKPPLAGGYIP